MGGVGYVELKVREGFDRGRWASGSIVAMSRRTQIQVYLVKMNFYIVWFSSAEEGTVDFALEFT